MIPPGLQDEAPEQFSPRQPSVHSNSPSHVPVDFFDPTGVHDLQRTFTEHSRVHPTGPANNPLGTAPKETPSTVSTVIEDDEFNFAEHLRNRIKRLVQGQCCNRPSFDHN